MADLLLVSVRIEKSKNPQKQKAHDFDERPSYADTSKSHLNKTIFGGDSDEISKRIEEQKIAIVSRHNSWVAEQKQCDPHNARRYQKWAKNSRSHFQGVITFSRAVNESCRPDREKAENNLRILDKKAREFLDDYCIKNGCEATYLIRHSDETSPHFHFMVTAYNENTHKPAKHEKSDLSRMQDDIGAIFESTGIHRGIKKLERLKMGDTNVIHRSVKQLHEDLPAQIAELKRQTELVEQNLAKAQSRLEVTEKKLARAAESEAALAILESRSLTYEKRVNSQRAELMQISSKINDLQSIYNNLKSNYSNLQSCTNELTEKRIRQGVELELDNIKQMIRRDALNNYKFIMSKLAEQRNEKVVINENKQIFEKVIEDHVDNLFDNFRP